MLVAKLIAENYPRPNERDLREASEITEEPVENILRVGRYGHTGPICDVYFINPVKMKLGYDDEIYYIVAAIVSKSGDIVRLKDVDGKLYEVW